MKLQRLLSRPARLAARVKKRYEEAVAAAKLTAMTPRPVRDTNRQFGEWLHTAPGRVWKRKRARIHRAVEAL